MGCLIKSLPDFISPPYMPEISLVQFIPLNQASLQGTAFSSSGFLGRVAPVTVTLACLGYLRPGINDEDSE